MGEWCLGAGYFQGWGLGWAHFVLGFCWLSPALRELQGQAAHCRVLLVQQPSDLVKCAFSCSAAFYSCLQVTCNLLLLQLPGGKFFFWGGGEGSIIKVRGGKGTGVGNSWGMGVSPQIPAPTVCMGLKPGQTGMGKNHLHGPAGRTWHEREE